MSGKSLQPSGDVSSACEILGAWCLLSTPAVTILLCTLSGERFLIQQLASLEWQTFKNWKLIASYDGSSTKSILRAFKQSLEPGQVEVIDGPRRGAPANFLFQACTQDLASGYYAYVSLISSVRKLVGKLGPHAQLGGSCGT
jgi:hypothetical protein